MLICLYVNSKNSKRTGINIDNEFPAGLQHDPKHVEFKYLGENERNLTFENLCKPWSVSILIISFSSKQVDEEINENVNSTEIEVSSQIVFSLMRIYTEVLFSASFSSYRL